MNYYRLHIETDDDFSVSFKGESYCETEFELILKSVDELDQIEVHGPWLSKRLPETKTDEFFAGLAEVRKNPDKWFCNTGGNRGIEWEPVDAAKVILDKLPIQFHAFLSNYAYEQGHAAGEEETLQYLEELADGIHTCWRNYMQWLGEARPRPGSN